MRSLPHFKYRFIPNWSMVFLTLIVVIGLTRLGFWQMQRGYEKQEILKAQARQQMVSPQIWSPNDKWPRQFQPMIVHGEFLETVFLLDNQHYKHRFGYNVISPFILKNKKVLLVDRGWVAGDRARIHLPQHENPKQMKIIAGQAYYPATKGIILGEVIEPKHATLAILEKIDIKKVSKFLHKPVYPFIIRLDKQQPNGFIREWPVVSMQPERHFAYALQWFLMALVVLILFFSLNLKEKT